MKAIGLLNYVKDKIHFSEDVMLNKSIDLNNTNDSFNRQRLQSTSKKKIISYLDMLETKKYDNIKTHSRRYGDTKAQMELDKESAMKMTLDFDELKEDKITEYKDKYLEKINRNIETIVGGSTMHRRMLLASWKSHY